MITSIWYALIRKIKQGLRSTNIVQVNDAAQIHRSAKLKDVFLKGEISVAENCRLIDGVTIVADSRVTIGRYTVINGPATDIYAAMNDVAIGQFCSIARHVSIQEYNHRMDRPTTFFIGKNIFKDKAMLDTYSKGKITIGNDVWIGAHSIVLSGVVIGHGAVVGANSVVTENVPPYAIVSGNPAKIIRYRFPEETIQHLLKIEWWNWPYEKIAANKSFFNQAVTNDSIRSIS